MRCSKRRVRRAGLRLVRQGVQSGFPKGLFTVRMYALQPVGEGAGEEGGGEAGGGRQDGEGGRASAASQ